MSSIIVLDSSDEETDSANRKGRLGSVVRNNQPPTQLMARVNPVKTANSAAKKTANTPSLPNDNFKIHLSSKRALAVTTNEPVTTEATPEKRVRRIKPTTVVRNTDDEWVNRPAGPLISRNGEQRKLNNPPAMLNKSLISNVKNSIRVVKSPITIETQHRTQPRIVESSPVPSGGSGLSTVTNKSPSNYVRVAWNGKEPKPSSPTIPTAVINKNITACVKEQPMAKSQSPPTINKIITTANSVKEPAKGMPLSTPIFSKNSVTIRRVMVSEDRSKEVPGAAAATATKLPPNSVTIIEQPKVPCPINNNNSTSIRRVTVNSGADAVPQYSVTPIKNFNNLNNSALRITQINPPSNPPSNTNSNRRSTSNPAETMKPIQQQQRQQNQLQQNQQHQHQQQPQYQHLPVLKRNVNNAPKIPPNNNINNNSPVLMVNTTNPTSVINPNAATIKRIVTVDLPQTPGSPPVITKSYNTAPTKRSAIDQTKPSMSMSVITKNHTSSLKTVDKKMSPPALPPAGAIMTRPSGLIVTPITCTAQNINSSPLAAPPSKPPSRTIPTTVSSTRAASKPPKTSTNRTSEQPITSMAAMFNMYPFMGAPPMMYDMDPTGGAFINPAYLAQRPMRSLEGASYPTMTPPVFNMNFPSFSGGSITPIQSTGTVASPTQSTGSRSTKSPITSTVTRPTSAIRSPAGFMGLPIDVDQPLPPMSPPVYNMNHPAFSSDMYNLMRSPHTIPSPAYSPVRSTKSPNTTRANPTIEFPTTPTPATTTSSSPVFHIDLDNFVKDPLSYPRNPCNSITSSTFSSNGPIFSVDSPVKNHNQSRSPPGSFKSPNSTITSPAQSTISDGSSVCEAQNPPQSTTSDGKPQNDKTKQTTEEDLEKEKEKEKEEPKDPLSDEYNTLLDACRGADPSEDMTKLIDTKLIRYYYSVHPDFVKSRGFRKAVLAATERIKKDPDLVYYHLRPVVDEMKARKKSKSVVFNNDEASVASETTSAGNDVEEDETEDDRIRSRQIKQLNKALYILTRKIHRLENEDVDLDDENSTYLVVERYKKRACEIYDKICDLTGESKNALRQVKKPIRFKDTDYPKFNKVVEAFVNRTKEFPDFVDVLRMLEFCNERYNFGLLKEEMSMIAEEAFIKIGKLLQNRRKADLYETVSHFTSDYDDPAANDPTLLAKLSENQKKKTSIGSIIDKYAREQIKRKAECANATGDEESNGTSESCESDEQSDDDDDEEHSNAHDNSDKKSDEDTEKHKKPKKPETSDKSDNLEKLEKSDKSEKSEKPTTNGNKSPQSPTTKPPSTTSPSPSTSAAFRTSPPHAFASPPASPLPRSISPALPVPPSLPTPPLQIPSSPIQTQPLTTSALKIFSVTSLNESVSNAEKVVDQLTVPSIDEIIISDEDL